MKIFITIYVAIGLIEFMLCFLQVAVIVMREEKENGYRYKSTSSKPEKLLALVKGIILFATPIIRTIVTVAVLFSEDAHEAIAEAVAESPNLEITYPETEEKV